MLIGKPRLIYVIGRIKFIIHQTKQIVQLPDVAFEVHILMSYAINVFRKSKINLKRNRVLN